MSDHAVDDQLRQVLQRLRRFAHWLTRGAGGADDLVQRYPVSRSSSKPLAWRKWRRAPVIPSEEGRPVLKFLASGGPEAFLTELKRLSQLGSPWASAALAFIALMPGSGGRRDIQRALELCQAHADRGDAYALYMCAWAMLSFGKCRTLILLRQCCVVISDRNVRIAVEMLPAIQER
jgi:hypothetical protein